MKLKLFISIPVGLALSVTASAQAKGGGGGAAAGPPSNPNAEMASGTGKYANFDQLMAHQHGGMYFIGKVAVDGGTLPWDPIPVIVDCNGTVKYDTHTDTKGTFSIESGAVRNSSTSEIVPQAGGAKPLTAAQLVGCQVKASLSGFRSSAVTIANGNLTDNPDIGTITLHLDEHASGYGVSPTTFSAPKDALKKFDKARSEVDKNPEGAQHELEKAVQIDPKFAEAWYQLGKLQEKTTPVDALASYEKAAAADPQFVSPYGRIAELAAQQKKWQEVADAADHYLKLDPEGTLQIWYFSAVGNYHIDKKDVAEVSAKKSLAMDPQHQAPNTEQLLAVILAGKGDYAAALDHLRNCLTYTPAGPNAELMKQEIALIEQSVVSGK